MNLRPYQEQAVEAVFQDWQDNQSTLLVMPTGTGKTQVFSSVIKKMSPVRALVLAHREELIWQAVRRIESLGLGTSVEMADLSASDWIWDKTPVVVSTIQTQISGERGSGRMTRFDPIDFGLLVIDEAHHATSPSYRKVIDYYRTNPDLRVLGVTATPDRADEQALGQVFQSASFDYEILDAINDGWLVPIEQQMVSVQGLDFSHIRTTAGDLNGADLAAVMEAEKNLQGIAASSIDIIGDKRTLVFTASVKQAEMLAEIFNRHRPGMANWVCGETPKEQRRKSLSDFHFGVTQVMCNCGVLTEGYDSPEIQVVIQARPTKSRCLYSQQIGRGTRPLADLVDGLETAEERQAAIASSGKPSLSVVDFVGNSGRHKLITSADILGGKLSDEVIELAEKRAKAKGRVNMADELNKAQADIQREIEERKKKEAARRMHLVAKADFKLRSVDPFDILNITPARVRGWDNGKTLSPKQRNILLRQGINPVGMPYSQQKQLLLAIFKRMESNAASINQCRVLRKRGIDTTDMTFAQAKKTIDEIASREGWGQRNGRGMRAAV